MNHSNSFAFKTKVIYLLLFIGFIGVEVLVRPK
jgi:hypothetical protein